MGWLYVSTLRILSRRNLRQKSKLIFPEYRSLDRDYFLPVSGEPDCAVALSANCSVVP
jgi:hypothetical protein